MGLEPIEKLVSKTNTFTNFVTRALICFPEGLAGELPLRESLLRKPGRAMPRGTCLTAVSGAGSAALGCAESGQSGILTFGSFYLPGTRLELVANGFSDHYSTN